MVAVAAVSLGAPTAARAENINGWDTTVTATPVSDHRITESLPAAFAYWHSAPDCPTGIAWLVMTATQVDPSALPQDSEAAQAFPGECRIGIRLDFLATASTPQVCEVVTHEIGHLIHGAGHTEDAGQLPDDPSDVMAKRGNMPPGCASLGIATIPVTTHRADGHTRTVNRRSDRKWCRRHARICYLRYFGLASKTLSERVMLQARSVATNG